MMLDPSVVTRLLPCHICSDCFRYLVCPRPVSTFFNVWKQSRNISIRLANQLQISMYEMVDILP